MGGRHFVGLEVLPPETIAHQPHGRIHYQSCFEALVWNAGCYSSRYIEYALA
jgi:predicted nicotinamide N-methyase